jgi:hypothetical protein
MEENGARIPRLGLPFEQQLMALISIRTYFKREERILSTSILTTYCLSSHLIDVGQKQNQDCEYFTVSVDQGR